MIRSAAVALPLLLLAVTPAASADNKIPAELLAVLEKAKP